MSERVFKKVNITGCSAESFEKAIEAAVRKAGESLHGMAWFEVQELRGAVKDGAVSEYQATIQVAFEID